MKKLSEIDLLKIKSVDLDIDRLGLLIEVSKSKANEAAAEIKTLISRRNELYNEFKTSYEIKNDFRYDPKTGEIIEGTQAVQ